MYTFFITFLDPTDQFLNTIEVQDWSLVVISKMSTITSETTYEPLNPRNTDKIQCDFTHFRAKIDQDEDKLPRGVSYIPFADYPVAVQNNPKYLHSRENIYNGYLTVCLPHSPPHRLDLLE